MARRLAAWARPRPSASASARLANTTVSHSQNATVNVNQAGSCAAAERLAAEELDQPGDGGDHRADLDHEHHRVADLHARIELAERVDRGGHQDGASISELERRSTGCCSVRYSVTVIGRPAVEGEVEFEDVHAGLAEHPEEASVRVVVDQLLHRRQRQLADAAMRWAWIAALALEICGIDAEAELVTASTGTLRGREAGGIRPLEREIRRRGWP